MIRCFLSLLCLLFMPAIAAGEPPAAEQVRYVMGTTATVQAWATDPGRAERAVDAAFRAFDRVDSLMSTWRDDSVLSRLNRSEPHSWVEVGPEVCRVLEEAKSVAKASGGAFDPTVLPLVRLWGFRGGKVSLPDSTALAGTLGVIDHELIDIDTCNGRVRLLAPGVAVDLGGIAKGYALDLAKEAMGRAGVGAGVIDLGGNLLSFGQGPARLVGIVDPGRRDRLLVSVPLIDASAATSGQYERFLDIQGQKFGHILDPRTGRPVPGGISVTVITDRAILADALATAAVVLGPEAGLALLEGFSGVEGLLAVANGQGGYDLSTTTGFASLTVAP